MNYALLNNWRDTVCPGDVVYMLGDLSLGKGIHTVGWWFERLIGHILMVKGSHDNGLQAPLYRIIHAKNMDILLIHNPTDIPIWWKGWTIHGHLHNQAPFIDHSRERVNVSVETIGYKPANLKDILSKIKGREDKEWEAN